MTISPCIQLQEGLDYGCLRPHGNKHFQLALLYTDVKVDGNFDEGYNGAIKRNRHISQIELTYPTKIYTFQAPQGSDVIMGTYKKTEDDFGYAEYEHNVTLLISAFTELEKRQVHALNNEVFKVILFNQDRTAEIYGTNFGMKTTDYDYQNQPEKITLKSIKKESTMPLSNEGELTDDWIIDAYQIFDRTFDRTFE